MELIKSKTKINKQKNKSLIYIKLNSTFSKNKGIISDRYENLNNSLKLKNTQSISTDEDDIKDNEIKEISSTKCIFPKKIIKNFSFIIEDYTPIKIANNILPKKINSKINNIIPNKFENKKISEISKDKININKNIPENEIKLKASKNNVNLNISNSKNKNKINSKNITQNNSNKLFKEETNKSNNLLIQKECLKSFPPKKPILFNNKYILLENNNKNNSVNKSCIYLDRSKIPNIFYNHIMIKDNRAKEQKCSKYMTISTTNRIKGKLLTILYFRPIKILK